MIKRIIDISEQAYLHVLNRQLCVDKAGETVAKIAFDDLGILILQHPAIVVTQTVVTQCQEHNVALLFCDDRHLPVSIILPLVTGHSLHTKVLREQIASKKSHQKRLWQSVVKAKIREQAITLTKAGQQSNKLLRLSEKVRSGDPDNIEAQAAREYWKILMGASFRRDTNADGVNSILNYGYSIMRAMVARSLVGTGLHPAIGMHHKNQYNGLCLADDVMEPLRPWVDEVVHSAFVLDKTVKVTKVTKQLLLGLLSQQVLYDGKKMPLMVSVHYLAAQLKYAMTDKDVSLKFPSRL